MIEWCLYILESKSMDSQALQLLAKRKGTYVKFEEFLRFREETNKVLAGQQSQLNEMREQLDTRPMPVQSDDWIQQSIDALEKELGTVVIIKDDAVVSDEALLAQLDKEAAYSLLRSATPKDQEELATGINFRGCDATIVNRDSKNGKLLLMLKLQRPLLMCIDEHKVEVDPDAEVMGYIDLNWQRPDEQ